MKKRSVPGLILSIELLIFLTVALVFTAQRAHASRCGEALSVNATSKIVPNAELSALALRILRSPELPKKYTEPAFAIVDLNIEGRPADSDYENRPFFHSDGTINPEAFANADLALENGSQPLSVLRFHVPAAGKNPRDPELLKIEELRRQQAALFLKDLGPLLEKQPDVQLDVLYPKGLLRSVRKMVESTLDPKFFNRLSYIAHSNREYGLEPWGQDDSKPLQGGRKILAPGIDRLKKQEADFVEETLNVLTTAGHYEAKRGNVQFEGGNLVVGARHVFLGVDIVTSVSKRLNLPFEEAVQVLEYEFGKPVFPVGQVKKAPYPERGLEIVHMDFHTDLTLAVGMNQSSKKEVVFLASAEAALGVYKNALEELAGGRLQVSPHEAELLRKELQLAEILLQQDFTIRAQLNRDLKARLTKAGYQVREVPSLRSKKAESLGLPEYINYVNVVFSGAQAVVPQLNLPILDRAAHAVYRSEGYDVVGMHNSSQTYLKSCGGPRCALSTMR